MSLILFISKWLKCSYPHCCSLFWVKANQPCKVLQAGSIYEPDVKRYTWKVPQSSRFPAWDCVQMEHLQLNNQNEITAHYEVHVSYKGFSKNTSVLSVLKKKMKKKPTKENVYGTSVLFIIVIHSSFMIVTWWMQKAQHDGRELADNLLFQHIFCGLLAKSSIVCMPKLHCLLASVEGLITFHSF